MPTINRVHIRRPWESKSEYKKGTFSNNEYVHLYHTSAWRKLSKAHLAAFPLCQCDECKKMIVAKPAHHTDHIKAVKDGGDFWDWNNLQSLNLDCHNRKSAKERRK